MHSNQCACAVENAIRVLPGVLAIPEIDISTGRTLIEGEPDPKDILQALRNEGYAAEIVTQKETEDNAEEKRDIASGADGSSA